jgi:hypothetical protein
MHGWISDVAALANVAKNHPEDLLALFFEITPTSQQKGREFLQRCNARHDDRDVPASLQARDAQFEAITEWHPGILPAEPSGRNHPAGADRGR